MSKKLLPCAAVYHVELPSADAVNDHLKKLPFEELQTQQPHGSGFVAVEPGDEFTYVFTGGFAFALRIDEKIVPASVVRTELKKRIAVFEDHEGYKPGRKTIVELRDMVVAELVSRALTKTKIVTCLYDTERKYLYVPALSSGIRERVMTQLVRAVESVKSQTIHVSEAKGSLTTRLLGEINGDPAYEHENPFGDFEVGGKVVMVGPESKITFDLSDGVHIAANGINETAITGAQVTEIALTHSGVKFRLTHDFLLKGIKFMDGAIDYEPDADPCYTFEQEAACQLLLVGNVVDALCALFDYKPENDEQDGSDLA